METKKKATKKAAPKPEETVKKPEAPKTKRMWTGERYETVNI
jgi:hypothetical protein